MPNISVNSLLTKKREAKKDFVKAFSLSAKKPLIGIFLDSELPKKTEARLKTFLYGSGALDVSLVMLADSNLESIKNSDVKILPYGRKNRQALLEAADMALTFKFSDVEEMLLHGVVPIAPSRSELKNYDPNHETGNSFIYDKEDPWAIFAALVRARETFRFSYDWKHIVSQGLDSVCN